MIALWLVLAAGATAAEPAAEPESEVTLHGDVKSFFFGIFPYDWAFLPEDPVGTALLDGRIKFAGRQGNVSLLFHHNITSATGAGTGFELPISAGVATQVPEAITLSWTAYDTETFGLRGRTDRFSLRGDFGPVSVTLGRQPFSFGHGLIFTPLDLVGPFNPAVVDQEYKPGYDALRVDGYWGLGGQATAAAVYAGDWDIDGLIFVGFAQTTFGVTDLGVFFGEVLSDEVFGLTFASGVGPVGLYGDAALTLSDADDTFFRGTVGANWYITGKSVLTGEFYVQTLGAENPDGYLDFAQNARLARGELWLLGRWYLGLAFSQEITPLIHGALAVVGNLTDPSGFVAPTLSWSVASNSELGLGAFFGIGKRPEDLTVNSEFGLYPAVAFLQTKSYF